MLWAMTMEKDGRLMTVEIETDTGNGWLGRAQKGGYWQKRTMNRTAGKKRELGCIV